MTTTVKIHVNGRYRAKVRVMREGYPEEQYLIDGNYIGSPNPTGERSFGLYHPAQATFDITEEPVPE